MKRISENSECYVLANVCKIIFIMLSASFICYYLLVPISIIGIINIALFVNGDVIMSLGEVCNMFIHLLLEPMNLFCDILSCGFMCFCISVWLITGFMYFMFLFSENKS